MAIESITLAAGAADPSVGPGRLIGLGVAVVICYLYWRFDPKRDKGAGDSDHSPTEPALPPAPRDAQVRRVSSHVSRDETVEPPVETHWWGRISRDARGNVVRAYESARHIAATGDSPQAPEAVPDDEPFDDFDLRLDAEPVPDDEPVDGDAEVDPVHRETREEYARRCFDEGVEKALIVKALQEHYRLSRAQAYRVAAEAEPRKIP